MMGSAAAYEDGRNPTPLYQFVEIETCKARKDGIFELAADDKYQNHIGTIHASALFALAEASSGNSWRTMDDWTRMRWCRY